MQILEESVRNIYCLNYDDLEFSPSVVYCTMAK